MQLVVPSLEYLPSYVDALERGWCFDNLRAAARTEELARIDEDAAGYLASLENRKGGGVPVTLPDGSTVPRLPGIRRWMWDGEFAGNISLRWQHGTASLPDYCLGHVGYSVVPWKERRGYATEALRALLPEARALGLPYVEITTTIDNMASRRVIEKAGGVLHEQFHKPAAYGGALSLRYRIALN